MRIWSAFAATAIVHTVVLALPVLRPTPKEDVEPPVVLRLAPPPEPEPVPEPPPEPEPEPEIEPPPPEPEPAPEPPPPEPRPLARKADSAPPEPTPEPPPPAAEPVPSPEPPPAEPPPPTPAIAPEPPPRAAPPPRPAAPKAPSGPGKAEYGAYAKGMRAAMLRHRRYPAAALRGGLEGVTKVELSIDRKGRLVGVPKISRSSGHTVLDDEALRIVRVAAPYGALPEGTTKDVMVFVIPIDFHLE